MRRTAGMFEVSSGALRGIRKKTARIQAMLAKGFVSRDPLFVSGGFGLGAVLESADLALDLGDALLRFENLAIDPIQFT